MNGPNPELYAELSKPHESAEAGATALKAFFADVYELRKKHRIPDVLIAAAVNVNPGSAPIAVCYYAGDQNNALPMAATAFRAYREEHNRRMRELAGLDPDPGLPESKL